MALTFLTKAGYVAVQGSSAPTRRARLTAKGRAVQMGLRRQHAEVERAWRARFGASDVRQLRLSLETVLTHRDVSRTASPPWWLARSKPYRERTEALVEDPRAALPHYPMVLHRGGWPDGS